MDSRETGRGNKPLPGEWQDVAQLPPRRYRCGYCGANVGPREGWLCYLAVHQTRAQRLLSDFKETGFKTGYLYICPMCNRPSFFEEAAQVPMPLPGVPVAGIQSDEVEKLYCEARHAIGAKAYTAAVMACRKLLMNIAVHEGADESKTFQYYVDYLDGKGFVPPHGKVWIDHIRTKGNEANHEIRIMSRAEATETLDFVEMLLKFIYEYPAKAQRDDTSSDNGA